MVEMVLLVEEEKNTGLTYGVQARGLRSPFQP